MNGPDQVVKMINFGQLFYSRLNEARGEGKEGNGKLKNQN